MKTLLISLLVLVFWQHADGQPAQTEPAQLIIYREKEFLSGLGTAYAFKINGQKAAELSPNRYVQLPVTPGRIKIEFYSDYFTDSRPLWLKVEAGQTYYVKTVVEVDFLSSVMLMALVESQQARKELRRMKPENANSNRNPSKTPE
ncbi:DUF2846 domain-containing protein [Larkinella rosea]|uniref:DUF2846 domain-containing protein n=1 Tax=Larkinella rosea TaxID=2025312 RepID=A0A3P1BFQ8_9BACT|nr:DUF2846 domain-containing protein [Larkinella rosea]RRA99919.1 DUF2846 domain-containing protein [Larkinella rosea]